MNKSHQTSDVRLEFLLPAGIRVRPLEPSDRAGVAALFNRLARREAMDLLGMDPEKPRRKARAAPESGPEAAEAGNGGAQEDTPP